MKTAFSDLEHIEIAFSKINKSEIIALCNSGITQSAGLEIAEEAITERGGSPDSYSVIFWHNQSHESFDKKGNLLSPLYLHWRGNLSILKNSLQGNLKDYEIVFPKDDKTAFIIMPKSFSNDDFDPANSSAVLKYLDQLRRSNTNIVLHELSKIRQIFSKSNPPSVIMAVFLSKEYLDLEDLNLLLNRIKEIASVKPGLQIWQDPAYTVGYLLDLMSKYNHKDYYSTLQAWSNNKKSVYREGVAKHAVHDIKTLEKLFSDKNHSVRWAAFHSLIEAGKNGICTIIDALIQQNIDNAEDIIRSLISYGEFNKTVAEVLKSKKYSDIINDF